MVNKLAREAQDREHIMTLADDNGMAVAIISRSDVENWRGQPMTDEGYAALMQTPHFQTISKRMREAGIEAVRTMLHLMKSE